MANNNWVTFEFTECDGGFSFLSNIDDELVTEEDTSIVNSDTELMVAAESGDIHRVQELLSCFIIWTSRCGL